MNDNNPFKTIEQEGIRSFYSGRSDERVRSGINSTLGTVRFLGKIADVYLTRLVDTMVCLTGGRLGDQDPPPDGPPDNHPPNLAPPDDGGPGPKTLDGSAPLDQ